jgi:hypothetical protein
VWQAVCSPFRNPLDDTERRVVNAGATPVAEALGRRLARSAGVQDPGIRWRATGAGPWFDNQVATLTIEGGRIDMRLEKALPGENGGGSRLESVMTRRLA